VRRRDDRTARARRRQPQRFKSRAQQPAPLRDSESGSGAAQPGAVRRLAAPPAQRAVRRRAPRVHRAATVIVRVLISVFIASRGWRRLAGKRNRGCRFERLRRFALKRRTAAAAPGVQRQRSQRALAARQARPARGACVARGRRALDVRC
jgi:hypothetical protein